MPFGTRRAGSSGRLLSAVAHHHLGRQRQTDASLQAQLGDLEAVRQEVLLAPELHSAVLCVDAGHVGALTSCNAQVSPLSEREAVHARVLSEHTAIRTDDWPRTQPIRRPRLHELVVASRRDEAELLAFTLVSAGQ